MDMACLRAKLEHFPELYFSVCIHVMNGLRPSRRLIHRPSRRDVMRMCVCVYAWALNFATASEPAHHTELHARLPAIHTTL